MEILLKEDETFRRAHEKYVAFTRDDEMVEAYESHMKWVRDYNSKMFIAKEEGIKLGLEKGKKEGRKEGIKEGRKEGIKEGRKEGIKEGRKEGIKEGRKEGKKEGRKEGELIGKIQLLQQILKKPVSEEDELLKQNINELETLLQNLQKEINI